MPRLVETEAAKRAYADYVSLGPERTVAKLWRLYEPDLDHSPTRKLDTLYTWSKKFKWDKRILAIAEDMAKEAEDKERAYRRSILDSGYSLAHERVKILKELADKIQEQLCVPGLTLKKQSSLLRDLRSVLEDIAKEQGHRKQTIEHSGDQSAPVFIVHSNIPRPATKE